MATDKLAYSYIATSCLTDSCLGIFPALAERKLHPTPSVDFSMAFSMPSKRLFSCRIVEALSSPSFLSFVIVDDCSDTNFTSMSNLLLISPLFCT